MRQRRRSLIASHEDYDHFMDLTYDNYIARSAEAKKLGGRETINFVRENLLRHAHDVRTNGPSKNKAHVFKDMVLKGDMSPSTYPTMRVFLHGQRQRLQLLAAEMESMLLVRFLEDRLRIKEIITPGEVIQNEDDMYKPSEEAEDALTVLPLAYCG